MKTIYKAGMAGVVLAMASTAVLAGGGVGTRSVEDANADLMRTYRSHGGPPANVIRSRSVEAAHADLVRDWGAKVSADSGPEVPSRSVDSSYIDLMRIWGALPPTTN